MAVDVGGGTHRSRWMRGTWPDKQSSFSISIDQSSGTSLSNRASEIKGSNSSSLAVRISSPPIPPRIADGAVREEAEIGLRSRHSSRKNDSKSGNNRTSIHFFENEEAGKTISSTAPVVGGSGGGAQMSVVGGLTSAKPGKKLDLADDGCMIPLMSLSATDTAEGAKKIGERRGRFFQRALSCDVEKSSVPIDKTEEARVAFSICESPNTKHTTNLFLDDCPSFGNTEGTFESGVRGGQLNSSTKDSGIVCSDEDLRSILSEVTHTRRMSVESKRERMKSNRSLSLDSSFFKMHIKRLQADSPYWLSRILSQRERRDSGGNSSTTNGSSFSGNNQSSPPDSGLPTPTISSSGLGTGDGSPCLGDVDSIRRRSLILQSGKKGTSETPETITEDFISIDDGDSEQQSNETSRRASTVSGSDDECSLLLVKSSSESGQKHGTTNPCSLSPSPEYAQQQQQMAVSKVVWNESSVVDAEIFGHAIEIYLTSVGKGATDVTTGAGDAVNSDVVPRDTSIVMPMVSTLKGLFVK